MIVMIATALVCAVSLLVVLAPMMRESRLRIHARVIGSVIVIGSLGLYLAIGSPDLPSASAAFETDPKRAQQRLLIDVIQTSELMLAGEPDNVRLLLVLADAESRLGRTAQSIGYLEHIVEIAPNHIEARTMLGALLFGTGMIMRSEGVPEPEIKAVWQRAFEVAPKDVPYRKTIQRNLETFDE